MKILAVIAALVVALVAVYVIAIWNFVATLDDQSRTPPYERPDLGGPNDESIAGLRRQILGIRLVPVPEPPTADVGAALKVDDVNTGPRQFSDVLTVDVSIPRAPGAGTCSRWGAEVIAGEYLRLGDEGRITKVRTLLLRQADVQRRVHSQTSIPLPARALPVTEDDDLDDISAITPLRTRARQLGLRVRRVSVRSEEGFRTAWFDLRSPDVATADAAFDALTAPELMPASAAAGGRCLEISLEGGRLLYAHGTIPRLGREVVWRHPR